MANCIDYFATLGRASGPLTCKKLEEDVGSAEFDLHPSSLWNKAITDITLIYEGENLPDEEGWNIVTESVDGVELPYPRLVFRRRQESQKIDHIVEIRIIPPGVDVPQDFQLVLQSVSGSYTSYLYPTGYIAIRRAKTSSIIYIKGEPILDDVAMIWVENGETSPDKYHRANVAKPVSTSLQSMAKQMGMRPANDSTETFAIGYRQRSPVGLTDLRYNASVLDRYPKQDNKDFPLPENALPLFAFPHDLSLEFESSNRYPLPHFFTFVFTDADGKHMYAACLHFFEKLSSDEVQLLFESVYGDDKIMSMVSGTNLFCPKVICVISSKPYYRAMRRYLRQLYSLSLSSLPAPLESFVAALVAQVPLPVEGGRPFHILLDSALISPTSRALKPIKFDLPPRKCFPLMDLDFAAPLRCLSVELVLAVFALLLQEAKIAFMCTSGTLLTETMETLKNFLFPLTWSSTFISRLPKALSALLQAPGGFMVGLHVEERLDKSQEEKEKEKRAAAYANSPLGIGSPKRSKKKLPAEFSIWAESMIVGTYIVDLNENSIFKYCGGGIAEQLEQRDILALIDAFPALPRRRLQGMLDRVAQEFAMGPSTDSLEHFDSAFDMMQISQERNSSRWSRFPTMEIRDWFLVFMIDALGPYVPYIIPPEESMSKSLFRTFQEQFRVSDYIEDLSDGKTRVFLEKLAETQMFSYMFQERANGSSLALSYFEEASHLYRKFGLHLVGAGSCSAPGLMGIRNLSVAQLEMSVPLHRLLEAYQRLAHLSRDKILTYQPPVASLQPAKKSSGLSFSISKSVGRVVAPDLTLDLSKASFDELLDLKATLKIREEMDEIEAVVQNAMSGDDSYMSRRGELDRYSSDSDLNLQHAPYGPLIIPGPLRQGGKAHGSDADESDESRYSYSEWPRFDENLLDLGKRNAHHIVRAIRHVRTYTIEKVNPDVRLLQRDPAERLSFCYSGALVSYLRPRNLKGVGLAPEVNAVVSSVLDGYQCAISRLCLRSLYKIQPIADVLQMLGIVSQIERLGLLEFVQERIWRSIILVNANIGGDLARKISYAVNASMTSYVGENDCLSVGQYMRAIAASKRAKGYDINGSSKLLDASIYLEEMGYNWFLQRTAFVGRGEVAKESKEPIEKETRKETSGVLRRESSGAEWKSFLQSMKIGAGFASAEKTTSELGVDAEHSSEIVHQQSTDSANLVIKQFNLSVANICSGLLSCARPQELLWARSPLNADQLNIDKLDQVQKVLDHITLRLRNMETGAVPKVLPELKKVEVVASANSVVASASSETSALSLEDVDAEVGLTPSTKRRTKSARLRQKMHDSVNTGNFTDDEDEGTEESESGSDSHNDSEKSAASTPHTEKSSDVNEQNAISPDKVHLVSTATSGTSSEAGTDSSDVSLNASNGLTEEPHGLAPNVVGLQAGLLELHCADVFARGRIIGISCRTPCTKCSLALLEEEVLAQWAGLGSVKVNANESTRDILSAHKVSCPHCKNVEITPTLCIKCYEKGPDGVYAVWEYAVPHLSTYGLQFLTEELMEKSGKGSIYERRLYSLSPVAYWNTYWYSSRFNIPTGFVSVSSETDVSPLDASRNDDPFCHGPMQGPIVVGWASHTVRSRIEKLFASGGQSCELALSDVYPQCNADDITLMQSALQQLDGSNPGTKAALLLIAKIDSLFGSSKDCSISCARVLYEALLTIASVGGSDLLRVDGSHVLTKLDNPSPLDLSIYETIKCVLGHAEYEALHTTEDALKGRLASKAARAFRYGYGLLL